MPITNNHDIPLTLAVWMLHDDYDYVSDPNYISATRLLKPTRQIILGSRVPPQDTVEDVDDYTARAVGRALHDSIEKVWKTAYEIPLQKMGYPQSVIDKIKVNPTDDEIDEDTIAIHIEQRETREIRGMTVGGKFDMVADGLLQDNKSTSAYTWVYGGRDTEHQLQGSIYNWLDAGRPDKGLKRRITEDFIQINYVFTDWQKMLARGNPAYPQKRAEKKQIGLMTEADTEKWILDKLMDINVNWHVPEDQLPECNEEDLWLPDPQFKYYADPTKTTGRSTKNFDNLSEANDFMATKGKGIVVAVQGEPKRCGFCAAFDICTQKDRYFT